MPGRDAAEKPCLDIPFAVPFTHRLRTTSDVAGDDFPVLLELVQTIPDAPSKVLLVAEQALAQSNNRVSQLEARLRQADQVRIVDETFWVPGGESVKNDSRCVDAVLRQINHHDLDRRSYVVAIGGGAMLDAVGYAAAIAHRGIRLIRLPTTTLAQADSGVGVKNAINHFGKKNWIGTFAVPWAVINDVSFLQSLSDRDFVSGFSEAVKVSLLKSRSEFDWLCERATRIRDRESETSARAIAISCMLHLRHITAGGDPFEMQEARPLDYGHWSAHKLEAITEYDIRHGEAVAIGVVIDCFYSQLKHGFPQADAERVCRTLSTLGLPLWHDALAPLDRLLGGLEEFRQHLGGRLTITMLRSVGDCVHVHDIDQRAMAEAMRLAEAAAQRFSQS